LLPKTENKPLFAPSFKESQKPESGFNVFTFLSPLTGRPNFEFQTNKQKTDERSSLFGLFCFIYLKNVVED